MSRQQATELAQPHLSADERVLHTALGVLNRPGLIFLSWIPLLCLLIWLVSGGETMVMDWLIALAIGLGLRILWVRRYLLIVTERRLHVVAVKRFRLTAIGYYAWPLAQVHTGRWNEGWSAVTFRLRTPAKDWKLAFPKSRSAAGGTYKAALEIYHTLHGAAAVQA